MKKPRSRSDSALDGPSSVSFQTVGPFFLIGDSQLGKSVDVWGSTLKISGSKTALVSSWNDMRPDSQIVLQTEDAGSESDSALLEKGIQIFGFQKCTPKHHTLSGGWTRTDTARLGCQTRLPDSVARLGCWTRALSTRRD